MFEADPATPAARRIAAEIAERGPITFHHFMELALFDPDVGYYARAGTGPGAAADYLTSPEIHSAFAVLLTRQLAEMWRHLAEPDPFWLVEAGPGSGAFIADVLQTATALAPRFAAAIGVVLLEASPALRLQQEIRLGSLRPRVRWLDPLTEVIAPIGPGCIFANEVFDALPVHRVVMSERGLQEIYTADDASGLHDVPGPLSRPGLAEEIALGGGRLGPGQAGEVNFAAQGLIDDLARLIDRGYMLVLDYGEPASRLYGDRFPSGTLRCYWRHTRNREPYRRIGLQDITAHVDLNAVTRTAEKRGFQLVGATRQTQLRTI
jgi:SAM-dependent MidA family methyltransferase